MATDKDRDGALIERTLAGDMSAFEELVRAYEKKIYNLALRMARNEQDAMDLTQNVFIRIYKTLPGFKGDAAFSTWLYRVASNICIDFTRRSKRETVIPLAGGDEDEPNRELEIADITYMPDTAYDKREMAEAIEEGINALSAEHRLILTERDINGMSYAEIAEALELGEGTVKSRLFRAREQLRKWLTANRGNLFIEYTSKKNEGRRSFGE